MGLDLAHGVFDPEVWQNVEEREEETRGFAEQKWWKRREIKGKRFVWEFSFLEERIRLTEDKRIGSSEYIKI